MWHLRHHWQWQGTQKGWGGNVDFKSVLKTNGAVDEGAFNGSATAALTVWCGQVVDQGLDGRKLRDVELYEKS